MKDLRYIAPAVVALVAFAGALVLAAVVFGLLLGGSILATPQATAIALAALWCVGVGAGWLMRGGE